MIFDVKKIGVCGSTNDVLKDMARKGAREGTAVAAAEQTAGKGTKGRSWHSARGKGLYVSVLFRPGSAEHLPLLPLAAGLAAWAAVERVAGLKAALRWPNDIVHRNRKLGGILCESAFSGRDVEYAVVGLGLNLTHGDDDFPAELRDRAGSVLSAGGRFVNFDEMLAAYLAALGEKAALAAAGNSARVISEFETHSVFRSGAKIVFDAGAGPQAGLYMGLDPNGSLRLELPDGERSFASGEIVRLL